MAKSRGFAYNPSRTPINGTRQIGDLAIEKTGQDYTTRPGGVDWWEGPDEDLGYVVTKAAPPHHTPLTSNEFALSGTYRGTDVSLSNGGQTAHQNFGYQQSVLGDTELGLTGKVMFSVAVSLSAPDTLTDSHFVGFGYTSMNYQGNPYGGYPGNDAQSMGYCSDGTVHYNGGVYAGGFQTWGNNSVISIAINLATSAAWVRVNGGYWDNDPTHDPATDTGGFEIIGGPFYPVLCPGYEGTMTIQNSATYSIPEGYTFLGATYANLGFNRSEALTDQSFISNVNRWFSQSFTTGNDAKFWLENNGYWTSYVTPVLSLDAASYSGSGPWIDSIANKEFALHNGPTWSDSYGGCFNFDAASAQYASATSLSDLSTWTIEVWHYYDGTNTGSAPCIVTEQYPGSTSNINYSLGWNTTANFINTAFFDGGWEISGGYTLTAGNWYHIVGTYDGYNLNMYVNNNLVAHNTYVGNPISSQGGIILMRRWDNPEFWGGKLGIVNVYDDAINDSRIAANWNANKERFGLAAWPSGLTARYSANSYSGGNTLPDLSGNGFDMTLVNPSFNSSGTKYFNASQSTDFIIPGNTTIYSSNFTWSIALKVTGAYQEWASVFWSEDAQKNFLIGFYSNGNWWNGNPAFAPRIDTAVYSHQAWNNGEGYTNNGAAPSSATANYSTSTPISVLTVRKNGNIFEWFMNNDIIWTDNISDWSIPATSQPIHVLNKSGNSFFTYGKFTDIAMFGRALTNQEIENTVNLMAKNI